MPNTGERKLAQLVDAAERIGVVGSPSSTGEMSLDILGSAVSKKLVGELALFRYLQSTQQHYALGQITEVLLRNIWHEDPTMRSLIRQRGRVDAVSERQDTHQGEMTISAVFAADGGHYRPSILGTVPATGTPIYLVEDAFVNGAASWELSYVFLRGFENAFAFQTNPIFAVLHEAIYCQEEASNWSAERVRAEYPEFEMGRDGTVLFTGEMIYPWMFDELEYLRPLKGAAEILAAYDGWPRLYDVERLGANTVPCAAAVYYDDMYVERTFSEETARKIPGMRLWVTNEYEHNGLRSYGEKVLGRLLEMLHE